MNPKQEALQVIRDQVGDRKVGYSTTLTEVSETYETSVEVLVEALENEFGVELSEELLIDVETIGELCQLVARSED